MLLLPLRLLLIQLVVHSYHYKGPTVPLIGHYHSYYYPIIIALISSPVAEDGDIVFGKLSSRGKSVGLRLQARSLHRGEGGAPCSVRCRSLVSGFIRAYNQARIKDYVQMGI